MKYGYLRVSTEQQDEENQKSGIMRWLDYMQYTVDEWVIEHGVSGKKDYKKRLLGKLMEKLKQDDWLIVSEFTRLSRETFQMYEICKILVDRGVHVFSVKDNQILDLSADGKFRLAMYCYFAEKERERCSERTKEALNRIKATGKHIGRPHGAIGKMLKLDGTKDYVFELVDAGCTVTEISRRLNCSFRSVADFLKRHNIKTASQIKYTAGKSPEFYREIGKKAAERKKNKILMLEYAAE